MPSLPADLRRLVDLQLQLASNDGTRHPARTQQSAIATHAQQPVTHLVKSSTIQVAPIPVTCSLVCEVQTANTLAPLATPDLIPLGASSKTIQFSICLPSFSAPVRYLQYRDQLGSIRSGDAALLTVQGGACRS